MFARTRRMLGCGLTTYQVPCTLKKVRGTSTYEVSVHLSKLTWAHSTSHLDVNPFVWLGGLA